MQGQWDDVLPSTDPFERCALHGLCAFHAATSHSINTEHGRTVRIRQGSSQHCSSNKQLRQAQEQPSNTHNSHSCSAHSKVASLQHDRTADDAASDTTASEHQPDVAQPSSQHALQAFTAVDVLLALEERPRADASLSKQTLADHRAEHYPEEWHAE